MAELPREVGPIPASTGAAPAGISGATARDAARDQSATPTAPERGFGGKAWFWLPWPLLVALDLWSKAVAFDHLEQGARARNLPLEHWQPVVFDSDLLRFQLVAWGNPGTIWGLLPDATAVLMVVRCIAVVGLLWFLRNTPRAAKLQQFVLGLVLAGAIGNLYDNFTRADRTVRDFLRFSGQWPAQWGFPAFNVADSCITVGAIGLFLLLWREDRAVPKKKVS